MHKLTRIPAFAIAMLIGMMPLSAHAQRSAYGINWQCGYEEGELFIKRIKRAGQDDLSCLAGAGFFEEALPRIGGRMDNDRQRLRMLLELMVEETPEAVTFFEEEIAKGMDEAVLWMLISRGEAGLEASDRRSRAAAVTIFVALPNWARSRYGARLADALLAEGDSRAALTLATALRTIADGDQEIAEAAMIQARVIERFGSTDEAVALYEEAIELGADRLSAEAELRKVALMWRTGYIQTDEAVAVLRELVTIWRGENLGAGITLALARAYYFDQQLPQSLRLLASVAGSNAPEEIRLEAERRIRAISEDLFVRRLDPATIGDLMDVYELVRPMVAKPTEFWMGDLKLSEILVKAGLMARAATLMEGASPAEIKEAGGTEALLLAAQLMIDFKERPAARGFLAEIPRQSLTGVDVETFAKLEARSVEVDALKSLLGPGIRREVLAIILDRSWKAEAYGLYEAARAYSDTAPTWKDPTASYLARGERLDREANDSATDPRLKALSSAPKPSVYYANDLRPLLDPSAEVAGLRATLTQIGQDLSEEAPETPVEGAETNDESSR